MWSNDHKYTHREKHTTKAMSAMEARESDGVDEEEGEEEKKRERERERYAEV